MSTGARQVVDIVTGAWRAQALYAAVTLRIPDHIAAGHTTSDELAEETSASADHVHRLMRLLTTMRVFDGTERTGYRLTPVSELLRTGGEDSMRDMCLMYGQEFYRAWGCAAEAISGGRTAFEHAFERPLGAYLREQEGAGVKFQRAMNAGNVFFPDVPRSFDFGGCRTVVDVAGGGGLLLSTVLAANPGLRGLLFDLPHMVSVGAAHLAGTVGLDRCDLVSGDIFESVPRGGDVYLLSRVLQDWDDTACVALLRNCRRAMTGTARLLVLERVVPEDGAADDTVTLPQLWDLHLLMISGGRERTMSGYQSLFERAGLRMERNVALPLEMTMLVLSQEDGR